MIAKEKKEEEMGIGDGSGPYIGEQSILAMVTLVDQRFTDD